jgi:hypothetical protein
MDQNWQPDPPGDLGVSSPTDESGHSIDGPPPARRPGSLRRMVATAGLVIGLLAIGGVSVVAAASPAPTSSTPSASGSTGTTTPRMTHNCPNMGNGSSPNASTTPSG